MVESHEGAPWCQVHGAHDGESHTEAGEASPVGRVGLQEAQSEALALPASTCGGVLIKHLQHSCWFLETRVVPGNCSLLGNQGLMTVHTSYPLTS